ncbi:NAD(P)/FAD-dependent oxidoreductase [Falsiroseomonas tokyonensis]|uniref:NAD(P)/FAD-dependent oxidoreductase n=1 Tax=Falsiroseomonas tokyonensis TaxID=430521 RepID=A0ABV7C1L3_9PROT|nr:FAD-binding oxidoreductase [Falsiroseomonas tokyonensis]MBU8541141.1 FAD-binding oxidoreductase [Falsiroseomonas tokyonensis]
MKSLWEATAAPAPILAPLRGPAETAVAIIGAGYSGLSTALALAERGVAVTVLEAVAPGAGASGRNGGQVIPGFKHDVADAIAVYGQARGTAMHALGARAATETFALIARHGIDCDAAQNGWAQLGDTPAALEAMAARLAAWRRAGAPVHWLSREEAAALAGTKAYLGGWLHAGGGSVQPLSYARGLARAAMAAGAVIHAPTRATAIRREGADWRVETGQGQLRARRVLIATNALPGDLWPGLADTMIPVWSFQVATQPGAVPAGMPVVSDTRRVLRYFRADRDGRLVVGGKGRLRAPRDLGDFATQRHMLARLYPQLAEAPVEFGWGGQVAITLDRLPRLFRLEDGVFATIGCNGKGIAWCTATGPELATVLTGGESLALPPVEPLRPIPLHQLKKIYAAAGSVWFRLRDRLERSTPRSPA